MPRLILPLQIGILASALCAILTRLKDVMQLSKPPYSDRHRLIGQQNNADKGRRGSTAWSSTSLQLLTSSRQAPALHSRHCLTRHAERASTSHTPFKLRGSAKVLTHRRRAPDDSSRLTNPPCSHSRWQTNAYRLHRTRSAACESVKYCTSQPHLSGSSSHTEAELLP